MIILAKGSSPFFLAVSALVLRFFLYGKYRSSSVVKSTQVSILAFNSSLKSPCSSTDFKIAIFRFSKVSNCSLYFTISPICTSSKFPVLSFLYLEINGIVQSSFKSATVFLTDVSGNWVLDIIKEIIRQF